MWEPNTDTWRGGEALQAWEEKLRNANFPPNPAERPFRQTPGHKRCSAEDVAEQLGSISRTRDEEHRQVTLADGSLTSSQGSLSCSVMLRHKSHGTFSLYSACFHILTNLAFDVIIGYPYIRKYNLISKFPSLFSETCLQVHNCTKCRQCLPGFFQQERAPKDGETCSEVLLAVPCVWVRWVTSGSHAEVLVVLW